MSNRSYSKYSSKGGKKNKEVIATEEIFFHYRGFMEYAVNECKKLGSGFCNLRLQTSDRSAQSAPRGGVKL